MQRLADLTSILLVEGVQEHSERETHPYSIEAISEPLDSGLQFEPEEPSPFSEDEAALRNRLRELDEAQRRSEFESRESYVT